MSRREIRNRCDVKPHLSSLVDEAASGGEIIISKNGKPKAKLAPFQSPNPMELRKPSGTVRIHWIGDGFDAPDEEAAAFLEQGLDADLRGTKI